ncbi:MAG: ERCC4 domain-containing protein [Candidatus Micrarchaeota archaeon]
MGTGNVSKGKKDFVEIFIDDRETPELADDLKELGARTVVRRLDVGDAILSERVVAERKTRSDFEQSIIDGRLFQQATRMAEQFERAILIVEGESFEERVKRGALLGAIASLMVDHGIPVMFTRSLEGTAEFLFAVARREQLMEKHDVRLLGTKKARTLSEQQQLIIECLPGVGPKRAKELLRYFYSVENIMNATETELLEIGGMGKKRMSDIRKVVKSAYKGDADG